MSFTKSFKPKTMSYLNRLKAEKAARELYEKEKEELKTLLMRIESTYNERGSEFLSNLKSFISHETGN